MVRKLSLPLFHLDPGSALATPSPGEKPTVDAVRRRLGGRATTEAGAGELVTLTTREGGELRGVILFARGEDVDVWIERGGSPPPARLPWVLGAAPPGAPATSPRSGVVHRTRRADVAPLRAPASKDLDAVAGDARAFAGLREGERIRFQTEGGLAEGLLIEKCRFGALVQRDDGTVVGVGFRRVWPAGPEGDERN
jgi:hypothetical protein